MPNPKIENIRLQLSHIEEHFHHFEITNPSVSKASVRWQLDHSLKVINGVLKTMINSNPEDYKKDFKLSRIVLFGLNYIPRGRAKAPKIVLPPETIAKEDLIKQLQASREFLKEIDALHKASHFKHYIFGTLSKKQTLRFLELHTHHHLKIVKDIIKD